ncbi:MAG: hypothetical protein Q7S70_00260 [bacterium]|nr:hypothetical protein [bacterium]
MSKSIRKFIRLEKARIRKMPLELAEKEKLVSALYKRFTKNDNPGNLQAGDK